MSNYLIKMIMNCVDVEAPTSAPLTFIAKSAGATVKLTKTGSPTVDGLQYRMGTSEGWTPYTIDTVLTLENIGDSIQFQNTLESLSSDSINYVKFVLSGQIAAEGNTMSLMNYIEECKFSCFNQMFSGCTSLTAAPELPATILAGSCYSSMFKGCTGLVSSPELPATTLANSCYGNMFSGCTSLTSAPKLPATTLAYQCYNNMFSGCTSLTAVPELPATTLAEECYNNMFKGCTKLTSVSKLPATTLDNKCYYRMFRGCTGLVSAPKLPATTLTNYCYQDMFRECTSLTSAPKLPATTLAEQCYYNMFYGCTSLTSAPKLPATTLAYQCYRYMFKGCTKLNYINVKFPAWNPSNATDNWVDGVSSTGTFICPEELPETHGVSKIPEGWTVVNSDDESEPLTFTAEEAESTVFLSTIGSPTVDGIQYRLGRSGEWLPYTIGTTVIGLENVGDVVQFQNTKETLSNSYDSYVTFMMNGKIAATGNIQSMLNYSESCSDFCYWSLFDSCTSLTSAPELPATTLAFGCYSGMFFGCTSLTSAPELPATTLAAGCYIQMFYGCTSLTAAPELPATTLAEGCYSIMFNRCTKLNYIKVGFTEWNSEATSDWVSEVAETGTFIKPESLPETYGASNIPEGWTVVNY